MSNVLLEYSECVQTKSLYKYETSILFSKNNTVSICMYTQFIIYQFIPTNKNAFFLKNMKESKLLPQPVTSSEHLQEAMSTS